MISIEISGISSIVATAITGSGRDMIERVSADDDEALALVRSDWLQQAFQPPTGAASNGLLEQHQHQRPVALGEADAHHRQGGSQAAGNPSTC